MTRSSVVFGSLVPALVTLGRRKAFVMRTFGIVERTSGPTLIFLILAHHTGTTRFERLHALPVGRTLGLLVALAFSAAFFFWISAVTRAAPVVLLPSAAHLPLVPSRGQPLITLGTASWSTKAHMALPLTWAGSTVLPVLPAARPCGVRCRLVGSFSAFMVGRLMLSPPAQ